MQVGEVLRVLKRKSEWLKGVVEAEDPDSRAHTRGGPKKRDRVGGRAEAHVPNHKFPIDPAGSFRKPQLPNAKRLQQRSPLDLLSFTTWQMLFGSIPLILVAVLIPSQPIDWSPAFIAAMVYSVIPGNAIAWLLWFYALSRLPAGVAGLGTLAAPVIGVLAAQIQLGEEPRMLEAVGMVLIIGALSLNAIQALTPQKRV